MHDFVKKTASLALGVGSLGLLLVNAALAHGCGGSQPAGQSATTATAAPPANGAKAQAKADDPCAQSAYMPPTKAPVFLSPNCNPQTAGQAPPQQAPAQQAP